MLVPRAEGTRYLANSVNSLPVVSTCISLVYPKFCPASFITAWDASVIPALSNAHAAAGVILPVKNLLNPASPGPTVCVLATPAKVRAALLSACLRSNTALLLSIIPCN